MVRAVKERNPMTKIYRLEHETLEVGPYSFPAYPQLFANRAESMDILSSPGPFATPLHSGFPNPAEPTPICTEDCPEINPLLAMLGYGLKCDCWPQFKYGLISEDTLLEWFDHPLRGHIGSVWNHLVDRRQFVPVMYECPSNLCMFEEDGRKAQVGFHAASAIRTLI